MSGGPPRSGARSSAVHTAKAWLIAVRAGTMGVLSLSSRKTGSSTYPALPWIFLVIKVFQMLSFLVGDTTGSAPWPAELNPIQLLSKSTNIRGWGTWFNDAITLVSFWVSTVWVLVLLALMAWGIRSFAANHFTVLWPLRLLRVMGNLSAGVLYIPLLQCLLIPPPVPASAALLACASILCIVLVTLALLFSSVFYEANSLSKSTDAKVHGRCDVVLVLVQTALVVQASFEDESPLLRMVVFFIGGLVWLGSILYALPFLHHSMNRAVAAGATLFVWCTVCYTLNVSMRWTDAAIQLYCGLPLALLSGMFLADVRAHNVLLTPDGLLSNAVEVELKCRYLTAEALWGHALFRVREAGGGIGSWDDVVEDGTFGVTLSSRVPSATARLGASAVTDKGTSGEAAPRTVAVSIEDDPDAEEMRHLRARLPAATTRHVLAIYSAAASRFRSSALLQVFYARYYEFVLGNRHMQMSHMTQAERRSPALDLSFVVFQARKAAEDESTGAGGERMTVMVRVAYEKHTGEAKRFVQQASQKQHLFWAELVSVMPDMSRLHRLSSGTNTAVQAAEQAFADLHAINPHSLPMNRLCAAFHLHVTGNAEQAAALTQAADRQEEAQSKDHRLEGSAPLRIMAESGLDPWADNTSVVHIAATVRDVGLITKVNTEALKLFGYTRVQLERRSVFTLLPPGLGELHEDSMRSYMATGEGVPGVVGYTRISFAVIKSGAIVPVVSSIRDAPADDGPPAFSWAMREIRTALHYVLLDDGGTITALSSGSAAAFELDLSAFANGGSDSRMMADLVVEWTVPGVQAALLEQAGASLRVDIVNSDELIGEAQSVDGSVHGSFDAPDDDDASSTDEAILQALDERPARPLQVGNSRVPGFSAATSFWVHAQLQPIGLGPRGLHKGFVLSWSRIMESDVSAIAKAEARRNAYLNNSGSRSALKPVLSPRLGLSLPSTTPLQVQVVSARRSSTLFTARSSIAPPSAMQLAATAKASRMLAESAHSLPSAAAANAATPKAPGTEGSSQRERSRATAPARTHKTSGDAKSHDSGSSSSSTIASTMRSMARLRKILSNDSPPLLPGLFALTIAGAILTVLGLVLAIVGLTISGTILSEVKEDLEYVQAGSLRMVQKASAILAAQNLLYIARNWTTTSTGETSRYRAQIQGNATAFMDSHKRMYEIVRATDRSYDWTSRFITTRIFGAAQGGLDGSTVQRNLYEAGVAFGDLMQTLSSVVQMPLSVYRTYADGSSLGEPTLALMHTEYFRGGNSHDVMENSLGLGYSILTGSIEGLKVTQMYIVIGMTGAIALVFFAIFLPILSAIDRSADAIMLEFINLPLPIRRNLHDQAFRRARLLRRDYSADADDDDMFDDDDDDDVQAQEDMLRAAEEGEVDATDGLTVDWADMAAQAGLSSKRGAGLTTFTSTRVHRNSLAVKSGPALPTYKKSRASFGRFILRFSVPLGILVVYFVAIYLNFFASISAISSLSAVIMAAGIRASCTRESIIDLQRLTYSTTDPQHKQKGYFYSRYLADCVTEHTSLLTFGLASTSETTWSWNESAYAAQVLPVEGGKSDLLSPALASIVHTAMHGNACPFLDEAVRFRGRNFNITECEAFSGGIVKLGLSAVIERMRSTRRLVMDRQLRARFTQPAPGTPVSSGPLWNGHGWLLAADSFDYTRIRCDESIGCDLHSLDTRVAQNGILLPTAVSNTSWAGDVPASAFPGDGVWLPNGSAPFWIGTELKHPQMAFLEQLDELFLTPGLRYLLDLYVMEADDRLAALEAFDNTFAPAYLCFFALSMLTMFVTQVRFTNKDIQAKRSMLLYLPVPIVARVRTIRELIDKIVASDGDGVGAAPSRSHAPAGGVRKAGGAGEAAGADAAAKVAAAGVSSPPPPTAKVAPAAEGAGAP